MSTPSCAGGIVSGSGLTPLDACNVGGSGLCETLEAEGATDQNLIDVGAGCLDPVALLNELATNTVPPVSVNSSLSDSFLGTIGAGIDLVSDPIGGNGLAQKFNTAVNDWFSQIQAWLSSNWWWIILGIIGVLLLIVWAYGGFKLGFLD